MFYSHVSMEQINSTKTLFKFLRKLKVCGWAVVAVDGNRSNLYSKKDWSYSMRIVAYHPDVFRTNIEVAEDALISFLS